MILVVCGAKRTEPQYFAGLRDDLNSRAVDIVITQHDRDPVRVVQYAASYAERSTKDFDEIWCVVDVDDFDVEAATRAARSTDIRLAVSNPCFELWLLLHHDECRVALPACSVAHRRLKKLIPQYDKTQLDFALFASGVAKAVIRAKALDPSGANHQCNPSTSVWRLVEKIAE